jgi:hypothetical protein
MRLTGTNTISYWVVVVSSSVTSSAEGRRNPLPKLATPLRSLRGLLYLA